MKLARQHLHRQIKELEVQLDQASAGLKAIRGQLDEKSAQVVHLTALIADLRGAIAILTDADLKPVEIEQKAEKKRK